MHQHIPPEHALVPWLVEWAGEVVRKFNFTENGRTVYEDTIGHRVKHWVIGFGERVQFRFANDNVQNHYEGGWSEGICVGVVGRSSEYLVIKED